MSGYVTTSIYEVMRKASPSAIAAILFPGGSCEGYVDGTLFAMVSVNPNLEASVNEVLNPGKAADFSDVLAGSWPDVLGRRVLMPINCKCDEWQKASAMIFSHMCAY